MHWVKATAPDGRPCYLNLGAIQSIIEGDGITVCFLGGIAVMPPSSPGGSHTVQHSMTTVRETVAELMALPVLTPKPARKAPAKRTAEGRRA